jgi:hypothetical protein
MRPMLRLRPPSTTISTSAPFGPLVVAPPAPAGRRRVGRAHQLGAAPPVPHTRQACRYPALPQRCGPATAPGTSASRHRRAAAPHRSSTATVVSLRNARPDGPLNSLGPCSPRPISRSIEPSGAYRMTRGRKASITKRSPLGATASPTGRPMSELSDSCSSRLSIARTVAERTVLRRSAAGEQAASAWLSRSIFQARTGSRARVAITPRRDF